MGYIALTEEQKAEVSREAGINNFSGQIAFMFKGEEVGRTDLIERSFGTQRLLLAEMIGVSEFDDYWLIKSDGSIRAKASDIKGLSVTDVDGDYGAAQGLKYQSFLKRHSIYYCPNCGEIVDKDILRKRLEEGMTDIKRAMDDIKNKE